MVYEGFFVVSEDSEETEESDESEEITKRKSSVSSESSASSESSTYQHFISSKPHFLQQCHPLGNVSLRLSPRSMIFLNSKKPAHTPGCLAVHMVIAALFLLMALIAFVGVYTTHFLPDGVTFGNSSGSLAIIAFTFTLGLFFNQVKACVVKCDLCGTAGSKK